MSDSPYEQMSTEVDCEHCGVVGAELAALRDVAEKARDLLYGTDAEGWLLGFDGKPRTRGHNSTAAELDDALRALDAVRKGMP